MDISADVDQHVASIAARHPDDPGAALAAAWGTSKELSTVGERVLEHFVLEARASGQSWSQVGAVLGVSKQAAQKRFSAGPGARVVVGGLFSHFDSHLAQACMTAVTRAGEEGAVEVSATHLLFGVAAVGGGRGAAILGALGYGPPPAHEPSSTRHVLHRRRKVLPFSSDARAAFERLGAIVEERRLAGVGTEHLLLALADDAESAVALVLHGQGISRAQIEQLIDAP